MFNKFCVFIISHGRPNNVVTLKTLKRCGYFGPLFIVCDNEDKTIDEYRSNFGEKRILVFDKIKYAAMVDNCDNFQNRRTTTHARNACFDFAASLGFECFLVLDDDYTDFRFCFDRQSKFVRKKARSISKAFDVIVAMLEADERIDSICILQTGDLMGGGSNGSLCKGHYPFRKRKAMNSFFCKTNRRFWFFSRLNEDVNTYLALGSRGRLFFTIPDMYLQQAPTQKNKGGMSEAYLSSGTYVKSFYSVMICPSFAKVADLKAMGRIHHQIDWEHAVPKIIDESHRKP
jgi:hypothetical protein